MIELRPPLNYKPIDNDPTTQVAVKLRNAMLDNNEQVFDEYIIYAHELNADEIKSIIECSMTIGNRRYFEKLCECQQYHKQIVEHVLRIGNLDLLILADYKHCNYDRSTVRAEALVSNSKECLEYIDYMLSRDYPARKEIAPLTEEDMVE